jgi:PadR family transcriptional regulator
MKGTYLGEFEELVLLVIGILNEEAYGVAIKNELEVQSKRSISIGAVHAATNRLEDKGSLESEFGNATNERGGKRKKYYKVTMHGQKALKTAMEMRNRMWQLIPESSFSVKLN